MKWKLCITLITHKNFHSQNIVLENISENVANGNRN